MGVDEDTLGTSFRQIDSSRHAAPLLDYLDGYASMPEVREAKRESLELLAVGPGSNVLDVGCGTGDDVLALAALVGPTGSAVGVDSSAAAVAEAKRRAAGVPQASFQQADAERLPYPDARFHGCRCDRTLQHVPDAEAALLELVRVAKPRGRVVVTEVLNMLLVDGEPDQTAAGRTVRAELWPERESSRWIGYMLPLLFARAGLVDCEAVPRERSVRTLELLELMFPVRSLTASAVDAGRLEPGEGERWLAGLEAAAARGGLELRMTFLHAHGQKPGA